VSLLSETLVFLILSDHLQIEEDSIMTRIVRGALLQATYTGDKDSMIAKHVKYARQAAEEGAQVMCFQELFFGPYFCQVQDTQYYSLTEPIPDGPTTRLMQDLAKETGMVLVVPLYEEEGAGIYYNTAAVIDADGTFLGKYRKTHIPQVMGFWEKFYFRPGNLGYPVFDTAVGKVGVYICYDRHFPEGARMLGLNGAEIVFIPSATSRGLSQHLWKIEQTSHAIANGYFVGTINRVGIEEAFGPNDYYGQSYFCTPRGEFVGEVGDPNEEELIVRDLDLDLIREVRNTWQFYRDRRPEIYGRIVEP
jgi:beta-ureidopropionase